MGQVGLNEPNAGHQLEEALLSSRVPDESAHTEH